MENRFDVITNRLRTTFNQRRTLDIEYRLKQLNSILKFLNDNEKLIIDTIEKDLRKPSFETRLNELELVRNDCLDMIYNINKYSSRKYVSKNLILIADDAYIYRQPYGLILIIGTWNYPLLTLLLPLVGAIAAGNVCIIKASEVSVNTADLIGKLLPEYIDNDCYQVVNGGPDVTQELLKQKFDYIFFTGSNNIGRLIHESAAKHLTPATLELGGKSPVYIDNNLKNLKYSLRRILWGKLLNAGQTCVAPDYILCNKEMRENILNMIPTIINEFYNNRLKHCKDFGRIINRKHFDRLQNLLVNTNGRIVYGGECDANDLYISLTIVIDLMDDDPLMKEEIFGPILPILCVDTVDDAIEFLNKRKTPLTLYVFSEQKTLIEKFIKHTSSGSFCANDVVIHFAANTLPFGGLGESGFGSYHGEQTYNLFSHNKSILIRNFNPFIEWVSSKRYPPYKNGHFVRLVRLLRTRKVYISVTTFKNISLMLIGALMFYIMQIILTKFNFKF